MAGDRDGAVAGELTVGGRARSFAMYLPRGASGGTPLVLVLHGNHPEAGGWIMRQWTTFDQQADVRGFAVAYPDGYGGCWADGRGVTTADEAGVDDVAFLRAPLTGVRPDLATRAPPSSRVGMRLRVALAERGWSHGRCSGAATPGLVPRPSPGIRR
jgi:polyhydroxybutyrate depolymerase